jgi:hypothetical protein
VLDVVLPVYNEVAELEHSVRTLRSYLDTHLPWPAVLTIADNASTDGTWDVASGLAARLPGVRARHLDQKGRGRALKAVWAISDAEVVAYMDVDLATDLGALLPLVAPLVSGHSDIAIGSRLAPGARVRRGAKREVVSRVYNLLLHAALPHRFSDAQCGFKALRVSAAHTLLPLVQDNAWFFDTELLVTAERLGLRVHEVPVDWTDDPDSRVDVVRTAMADLRGIWRLWRHPCPVPATAAPRTASTASLAGIGGLSTVAYLGLLLGLAGPLGLLTANALAWTASSLANFAAHRHLAGGLREPRTTRVALWAGGLAATTVALALAGAVSPSRLLAVVAVILAGSVVSTARFVVARATAYRRYLQRDSRAA